MVMDLVLFNKVKTKKMFIKKKPKHPGDISYDYRFEYQNGDGFSQAPYSIGRGGGKGGGYGVGVVYGKGDLTGKGFSNYGDLNSDYQELDGTGSD